jgi:hypothetical protein
MATGVDRPFSLKIGLILSILTGTLKTSNPIPQDRYVRTAPIEAGLDSYQGDSGLAGAPGSCGSGNRYDLAGIA